MTAVETMRRLPPPIKPRRLIRAKDGYTYVTSDDRYTVVPAYSPTLQGGSASRPSYWVVKDRSAREATREYRTLTLVRELLCAPHGYVPWLVCDLDAGIVRVESSRADAVRWARTHHRGRTIGRDIVADGWFSYRIGVSPTQYDEVWVGRADVVHRQGFDPVQEPLYPYPDSPNEQGPRALARNGSV
ncbi:hypothetical protein ACFQ6C_26640 [Streptomyces sp. NPDC056454]|uniref:hypothetical protein n=1 Tax=Streptomyces sp. NPDC056454 TaxID=3345823 RepID=UPI0036A0FD83